MELTIPIDAGGRARDRARPFDQPPMPARERRLHARAYQLWTTLRGARRLPGIADLDWRELPEFAASSVLVEVGGAEEPPVIHFVGQAIAAEAAIATPTPAFAEVPRASLLGQLVRRLAVVRDRGAPASFEADFVGRDGVPTHYRGILLPFADAGGAITYIYGVISWKPIADAIDPNLAAAIDAAMTGPPPSIAASPWDAPVRQGPADRLPIPQRIAAARMWAALGEADRGRRAASLDAALSAAHDLRIAADADVAGFASAAGDVGPLPGGTIGRIVRLVFGPDAPRIERARHAAVLAHAHRLGLGPGMLLPLLERHPGGAAELAAAERRARRRTRQGAQAETGRRALAALPALGRIAFAPVDADHLLLLARRGPRGIDIVAPVPDPGGGLTAQALRRFAAS